MRTVGQMRQPTRLHGEKGEKGNVLDFQSTGEKGEVAEVFVLVQKYCLTLGTRSGTIVVAQLQCLLSHISLVVAPGWCNVLLKVLHF